jgi:hypothetical protein
VSNIKWPAIKSCPKKNMQIKTDNHNKEKINRRSKIAQNRTGELK